MYPYMYVDPKTGKHLDPLKGLSRKHATVLIAVYSTITALAFALAY